MNSRNMILIVIALLIQINSAKLGVDISTLVSTSDFQCMKQNNILFMSMRGYRSYGAVDPNAAQSLKNAKAAGLTPYVYHFPCTSQSAQTQAQALVNALKGLYDMVWIDVETNSSPNCGWSTSNFQNNCEFLNNLIKAYQGLNQQVGIYASQYMWTQIFGSKTNCADFTKLPLWYAHYDGQANFNDWTNMKFGGWSQPTMKQYQGTDTICNASVDRDYEA